MMLKELRDEVYEANMDLPKHGLVVFTWGNASGLDRERGRFVIKPSGVDYDVLKPEDLVICDLDGKVVEGTLNPSSDTPTHACLYRAWGDRVGGVVHTHSSWAVACASSAARGVPARQASRICRRTRWIAASQAPLPQLSAHFTDPLAHRTGNL